MIGFILKNPGQKSDFYSQKPEFGKISPEKIKSVIALLINDKLIKLENDTFISLIN